MTHPTVRQYQALVIAQGLDTWVKFKRPLNTAYIPRNLMRTATALCGKQFGPRDYAIAASELRAYANSLEV